MQEKKPDVQEELARCKNKTPETDQAIRECWPMRYGYPGWDGNPPLEWLCRKLERERNVYKQKLKNINK